MKVVLISIALFFSSLMAEGACRVTVPKCNNPAEAGKKFPATFYDSQQNADRIQNQCLGLANVYHDWCRLSKNDFVKTEFLNQVGKVVAEANVRGSTRCQIKYSDCPESPGWNNYSFNEYWYNQTDFNKNSCMVRAKDYFNWCGSGKNVVTAEFFKNYSKIASSKASCKSSTATTIETLQYKRLVGVDPNLLSLDIHQAAIPCSGKKKLLIYVHGGGWIKGDKTDVQRNKDMITFFTKRGFVFVSVNYRLFRPIYPDLVSISNQAQDIASAIKFIHKKAPQLNFDPNQTFLYGHSAGAHLVSLVGTDKRYLENEGIGLKSLRAVIPSDVHVYDVTEALKLMAKDDWYRNNIPSIEMMFGTQAAKQKSLSPMSYLKNNNIPEFLIISAGIGTGGAGPRELSNIMSSLFSSALNSNYVYANHAHFRSLSHDELVIKGNMGTEGGVVTKRVSEFLQKRFNISN